MPGIHPGVLATAQKSRSTPARRPPPAMRRSALPAPVAIAEVTAEYNDEDEWALNAEDLRAVQQFIIGEPDEDDQSSQGVAKSGIAGQAA